MSDPFAVIAALGVVPVIAIEDARDAVALADALLEGGLKVAEITFRTAAAAQTLTALKEARPELLIGAGTVLDLDSLKAAVAAGARFGFAPGCDPEILESAKALGLPFSPGVMTPSELGGAIRRGLEAIAAPFAHLGVRFVPTGGVSLETMEDWLKLKSVAAVGGTWIARTEDIRERRFADIAKKARAAVTRAAEIRTRTK
jgi:2-dehydro-3-deoxyphosphogluconate aldolase/(4S)-4-hydroxy-2-oxoglutarate aldolase